MIRIAVFGLLAACGDDAQAASGSVNWYESALGMPLASPNFFVQADIVENTDTCIAFAAAQASVDGAALDVVATGGWTQLGASRTCTVPTFQLPGAAVASHAATASTEIAIDLGDGVARTFQVATLFAPRGPVLEDPSLASGAQARIAWSASGDELVAESTSVELWRPNASTAELVLSGDQLTVAGNEIAFTMPATTSGAATLRVRTSVQLAVTSCIGLETCSAGVFEILDDLAVTVL